MIFFDWRFGSATRYTRSGLYILHSRATSNEHSTISCAKINNLDAGCNLSDLPRAAKHVIGHINRLQRVSSNVGRQNGAIRAELLPILIPLKRAAKRASAAGAASCADIAAGGSLPTILCNGL